jgi:hypothetical protein
MCEKFANLSSIQIRVLVSCQNSDTIFFSENAIFERIEKVILNVIKDFRSTLNESEFFNCMRSYFRPLASIESISKRRHSVQILLVLRR